MLKFDTFHKKSSALFNIEKNIDVTELNKQKVFHLKLKPVYDEYFAMKH